MRLQLAVMCLVLVAGCSSDSGGSPSVVPSQTASATPGPSLDPDELVPNLILSRLTNWHVELDGDSRLLRMTTVFSNIGDGAFELRGSRPSTADEQMTLTQIVFNRSGGSRSLPTDVVARYAGDGHDHWHAQGVVTLALSPVNDPEDITTGDKVHFCFFDNISYDLDLANAPDTGYYQRDWCGTPDSLSVRMGLSIGWGDMYHWDFAYQWVDISDLPGGTYQLRATVDSTGDFLETDETDNCLMSEITIPATGVGEIVIVDAAEQPC
jgi:hypothetical protein